MHNPPGDRRLGGKARVHELAKELGIPSRQILSVLQSIGVIVRSPSSTVDAADARRLRAHLTSGPVAPRPVTIGPIRRMGNNPFTAPPRSPQPLTPRDRSTSGRPATRGSTDNSFAADFAAARRRGRRSSSSSAPGKHLTGLAAEIMRRWPHQLMPDDARDWAQRWVVQWMEPREITAWWDAGMAWGDVARVSMLKSLEMTPATMAEVVGDRTVLQLLRSGVSAQDVALRLRDRDQR